VKLDFERISMREEKSELIDWECGVQKWNGEEVADWLLSALCTTANREKDLSIRTYKEMFFILGSLRG
jgi:hypothetical protein